MITALTSYRSPNHGPRGADSISMLVLHYTGMPSAGAALEQLCLPDAKVSAHYVVDEAGLIYQLVDEAQCAWHAGVSYWRGRRNVNPVSLGIEIVNPGHEFGYRPFPTVQMEAVAVVCADILTRHAIEPSNVVGHSDIAPSRKQDPGELFDWEWLHGQGIGAWPDRRRYARAEKTRGEVAPDWGRVRCSLKRYGYDIEAAGELDAALKDVITAFQRHFRPRDIGGGWADECDAVLTALIND